MEGALLKFEVLGVALFRGRQRSLEDGAKKRKYGNGIICYILNLGLNFYQYRERNRLLYFLY